MCLYLCRDTRPILTWRLLKSCARDVSVVDLNCPVWGRWCINRWAVRGFVTSATVERLEAVGTDSVFFLGSAEEQAAFLEQAEQSAWYPRLLVPGALASARLLEAAAPFDGRIFVAWPAPPLGERLAKRGSYLALSAKYDLPRHHLASQLDALAGALVLVEGLELVGRDLSRQRLVEELEGLRALDTGIVPLVSYGPNRRQGVRACRITAADLMRKTFVPAGHS